MIDFRNYLEYAEKYLNMAVNQKDNHDINWLLFPATILSWSAIECFVNNMLDDFSNLPSNLFSLHERSLLLEKKIIFIDEGKDAGKFVLKGKEYKRLDQKILFLIWKFSPEKKFKLREDSLWNKFVTFKNARDKIVHPSRSKSIILNIENVYEFRETSIAIIKLIAEKVWKTKIAI